MSVATLSGRRARVVLIALTIAAVAAPSAAEAGRRTRTAVGVGLAAGVLGLAIGANAARADEERVYVRERPRCWTERRTYENRWGDLVVKRVRVCD